MVSCSSEGFLRFPATRKIALFIVAAVAVLGACTSPKNPPAETRTNQGLRRKVWFGTMRARFNDPGMLYAPFIFWFWDEPLDPAKMAGMARTMSQQGFNPGYAHARKSMVGTPGLPVSDWLGDRWFAAFGAALKEAEAAKTYLGYCDEYWWPSFQAGGRVLQVHPELRAQSLRWETRDVDGGEEAHVPASFFAVAGRGAPESESAPGPGAGPKTFVLLSRTLKVIGSGAPFTWKAPPGGTWRVYVFKMYNHDGADGGKVNYIDARLAPTFVSIALEPYAEHLGDMLGGVVPGDFTDNEGDYGWSLAWSGTLDRAYRNRYGRDIRLWMPLMVDRDAEGRFARARWDWFDLVSDIYADTFRAVTDWHEKRGMSTTAHFWEEGLQPQVNAVGDHMKMLRALTMPGQDCLGRKALRVHDFKETASVAEFENRRAATELMGAGGFEGTPWGTFNPVFLKEAANAVTAWGMSHIIPHGVFTTRKLSGNPWPPDWYDENPMYPYLHLWTAFMRRASYINAMGRAVPDVLLYNPLESVWTQADADMLDIKMWAFDESRAAGQRINHIDRVYAKAIDDLTAARVEFLVGDRHYLKGMTVGAGTLTTGELTFRTLVLPPLDILPLETARKIVDFAKAGGRVYALGELPGASAEEGWGDTHMPALMQELQAIPTFEACGEAGLAPLLVKAAPGLESPLRFVDGAFPMLQERRRIDGRDFFWLVNNTDQWQSCQTVLPSVHGEASIWDCETGATRLVASVDTQAGTRIALVFKPYEAYWLVFDTTQAAHAGPAESRPDVETTATIEGRWTVTIDPGIQPVMEFPKTPPPAFAKGTPRLLEDWRAWGLGRFSGLLDYSTTVKLGDSAKDLKLDLGRVCHAAEVWVNGTDCGARLWGPYVFDVGPALKPGQNEIRVRVANLINNSYGEAADSGLLGPVRLVRWH